ncbi:hypothetical protein MNAN1_000300 [Malassezia nana]|uniref:Uncharacterized protein n=1 Tax=Malassezia nana TaxID=180528 RepID=A0AAF0EIJ9_9BASI|nr:hypothetical protein MNAN1_000300 [Malassezia nana]
MHPGGLHTPQPQHLGILRSPHTPGTGSSVRFGMRTYEDGEESLLTASVSSTNGELDAGAELASRDVSLRSENDSLDMSFTESFLRREVDGALAGLEEGVEEPVPATPARPAPAEGPATARPTKLALETLSPSPSPENFPAPASPDKPLASGSPTIRATQRAPVPDESLQHTDESAQHTEEPMAPPSSDSDPLQAADLPAAQPAAQPANEPIQEAPDHRTDSPAQASTSPPRSLPADDENPFKSPGPSMLARSTGADSSLGSSAWGTPRGDASVRSAKSAASPGAQWPGMYEFSYLTEKDALDEEDTGPLVPYAVEALSTKLFTIDKLDHVDARELLDMIVALDRTHTQRTLFLQHRLARSHHLTGLLRASLEQAQSKNQMVETCVHEFLTRKAAMEAAPDSHNELRALTAQLEERLASMHGALLVGTSSETAGTAEERERLARERQALAEERRSLETERRDLEVRLAEPTASHTEDHAQALEAVRQACAQDADVRVFQARAEAADEIRQLRAELAEARAPTLELALEERLQAAAERQRALEAHVADLERQLRERASRAAAEAEEREAFIEARARAEVQCSTLQSEYTRLRSERDEWEAALKAENHALQQRIRTLENDVSRRDLELVQLQSQRDRLADESLHFSLALAAKDQELSMIKRGTQSSMYRYLLTQRTPVETRPALGPLTNRPRTAQETLERAKRVLHTDPASSRPGVPSRADSAST